ncbi:hypothetical protein [Candidatus Amarolinea aalborgensis]
MRAINSSHNAWYAASVDAVTADVHRPLRQGKAQASPINTLQ